MEEVIVDTHKLELEPDLEAGEYSVSVGVYYWMTGDRLPLYNSLGQPLLDGQITLPSPITLTRRS
jgi:hypothetical protein